ncbi:MAG TPA: hypothetical protein VGS19_24320 [Streptosporangiaceae bacterium]|nr:hypothetical protein [Streptosporangiaceae bacterium]
MAQATRRQQSSQPRAAARVSPGELRELRRMAGVTPPPGRQVPPIFRVDVSYLPPLKLDARGDVAQMIEGANQIFADSPAAALSMCGVLCCFSHPYRSFAVSETLKFLQTVQWSPQFQELARAAAAQERAAYRAATSAGESYSLERLLKLELREQEIRVIGYFYGRRNGISQAGQEAARIARQLQQAGSVRAQATAHIIAAGGYQLGAIYPGPVPTVTWDQTAWDELHRGVALFGEVHQNKNLEKVIGKVTGPAGTTT